jgi:pectinesterase
LFLVINIAKMRMLNPITIFASFAFAASRISAPSGALVVGGSGPYSSISEAVAALSSTNTSEQVIFVNPGTYSEQVFIPNLTGPLTIYGYTSDDTSYSRNEVTITHSAALANSDNDDGTATLRVWTSNFKLYNINVKNTYGTGSQALALSANAAVSHNQSFSRRTS